MLGGFMALGSVFSRCFRSWFLKTLAVLFLLLFSTACKVENQKKEDVFASHELPRVLFRVANQLYELVSIEKNIIANNNCQPDCLDVAVIDNGVDLAHPDLYRHLRFDIEDQKVVGLGYDFLGDDRFASSNLYSPTLFSFGAEKIENGRIVGPLSDPLAAAVQFNQSFMTELALRLKNEPELSGTIFELISAANSNLYEIHKIIVSKKNYLESYENQLKLFGGLKRGDLAKVEGNPKIMDPAIYYLLEKGPWRKFLPSYGYYFTGYAKFIEMSESLLKEFSGSGEYLRSLETMASYLDGRDFDESTSSESRLRDTLSKLETALDKKLFAHRGEDQIYTLAYLLESTVLQKSYLRTGHVLAPSSPSEARENSRLEAQAFFDEYLTYLKKHPRLTLDEQIFTQQAREVLPKVVAATNWVARDRQLNQLKEIFGYKPHFDSQLYRKRFMRSEHPYVSSFSAEKSHGSHVSGIILTQAPQSRIVPVRVSTESLQLPADIKTEYADKFRQGFGEWIQNPLVFRALGSKMQNWFPQWDFNDLSESNRQVVAQQILDLLGDSIRQSVDQNLLDHVFIEEIIKAIRWVGSQNIKIANISLGTSFERPLQQLGPENPVRNLKTFFNFLKFEFFKYRIGEAIREKALETVFVVAAGNESTWVDGQSRSALPVDISSPFLMKFERPEAGEVAPNNHLKNILAVGSIGREDQLSNYTNIFLGKHVPFIFARGEMILSSVKSTDETGIGQALAMWEPNLSNVYPPVPLGERTNGFLLKKWKELTGKSEAPTDSQMSLLKSYLMSSYSIMSTQMSLFKRHLAVKFSEHRAVMSGTSMASPTVAGALSQMILEKKQRLGLQGQNIYLHPEFKAGDLVQELLKKAEPLDNGSSLYGLKKLVGSKEMTDTEQDLDRFLRNLTPDVVGLKKD